MSSEVVKETGQTGYDSQFQTSSFKAHQRSQNLEGDSRLWFLFRHYYESKQTDTNIIVRKALPMPLHKSVHPFVEIKSFEPSTHSANGNISFARRRRVSVPSSRELGGVHPACCELVIRFGAGWTDFESFENRELLVKDWKKRSHVFQLAI